MRLRLRDEIASTLRELCHFDMLLALRKGMTRKIVDVAVIIPDASPVLTLARIDRPDLFDFFSAPIEIVDQVHYEITKAANDSDGKIAAWLKRMGNKITIVETL